MATDSGIRFEMEVARLYQGLGFRTKRDELIAGQQVDIVAEKFIPGAGLIRLLIECKFLERGSVSNQAVHDFISTFNAIGPSNGLSLGVIATNRDFTRQAKAAIRNKPIFLKRAVDLANEAFNLQEAAISYIQQYETSDLHSHYIPLRARGDARGWHPSLEKQSEHDQLRDSNSIDSTLLAWILTGEASFVTAFAEFGAGKTTLLERLKYLLLKRMADSPEEHTPIPLYLPLRELDRFPDLEDFVLAAWSREYRQQISLSAFWHKLANGEMVPLLDGFDEIRSTSDQTTRRDLFARISPLITRCGGAPVLTCRETAFTDRNEYAELLEEIGNPPRERGTAVQVSEDEETSDVQIGLQIVRNQLTREFVKLALPPKPRFIAVLQLQLFDSAQIQDYLRKYDDRFRSEAGVTWEDVCRFIDTVYDLSDLVNRPFLLEMVTKTILLGQLKTSGDSPAVGAASLYEIYTHIQLEREQAHKNRTLFTAAERQQLSQLVALCMYESNAGLSGIQPDALRSVALPRDSQYSALMQRVQEVSDEELATDVRLCAFLKIGDDGKFHFTHKSFVEYFLARQVRGSLREARVDPLLMTELPSEVLYFLGSYAGVEPELQRELIAALRDVKHAEPERQCVRRNLLGALCFAITEVSDVEFSDCRLQELQLPEVRWTRALVDNSSFHALRIAGIRLRQSELSAMTLNEVEIGSLYVRECSRVEARAISTNIRTAQIDDSASTSLACESFRVSQLVANRSSVFLTGTFDVQSCEIDHVLLHLEGPRHAALLHRVVAKDSRIAIFPDQDRRPIRAHDWECHACVLIGMDADVALDVQEFKATRRLRVRDGLRSCRGLLVITRIEDPLFGAVETNTRVGDFVVINCAHGVTSAAQEAAMHLLDSDYAQLAREVLLSYSVTAKPS